MFKRILCIVFIVMFSVASAYGADINDFMRGDASNIVKGTDDPSDMDTLITNYLQDPLDKLLTESIHGCTLTRTSASVITVSVGEATIYNAAKTIKRMRRNTSTTTINMANAGVGGIDSGSAEKASTIYSAYIVADADATTFTAICTEQGTAPSDVTYYRYVGSFFNDSGSNIELFSFIGKGATCKVIYDDSHSNTEVRVLNGGTAVAFTDVDCSSVIPTSAVSATIQVDTGDVQHSFRQNGSGATIGITYDIHTAGCKFVTDNIPLDSSQIFEYKLGAGTASTYYVYSYTFER